MLSLSAASELLRVLGDPTRVRLLALLAEDELSVAQLTRVTGLLQSRVSTHLGKLKDAGLVRDRRQGASVFYRVQPEALNGEAGQWWQLLRGQLDDHVLSSDRKRCDELTRSNDTWPDLVAGRMEAHYSPGRTWEATARGLLAFVQLGHVLDAGSGDGVLAALLAPRARSVTCLDRSERVIEAARERLQGFGNVSLEQGDVHEMPFVSARFDQVLLFNVLTCAGDPQRALREAFRVLRPGGALALVTLARHDRLEHVTEYGHVHAGFEVSEIENWLQQAGFEVDVCAVTSRERREPFFEVLSAFARSPEKHAESGPANGPEAKRQSGQEAA